MNDTKTQIKSDQYSILIQKNLPQHKMEPVASTPTMTIPNSKEKWSHLKSNLKSAMNDWAELEKKAPQKTPEEEQMEKVRSLISNLKERLAEFE